MTMDVLMEGLQFFLKSTNQRAKEKKKDIRTLFITLKG
jgi:hypothetical protein